jgi:membrane-bound lytic murein transglycosylase B
MRLAVLKTGRLHRWAILFPAAIVLALSAGSAGALTPGQWVQAFWPTAKAAGVSRAVYDSALANFTPDPDVLKKASNQAEFNQALWYYMEMMVSEERIAEGRSAIAKWGNTLSKIEARYGVDRYIVAAIWGMESHYGIVLENPKLVKNAIRSLATLAYSGGRLSKYGKQQLVAALKIVQRGDITPSGMSGSWAGAMGHTQFIPTTYNAYAADYDGDGRRNIWTSPADALASTANYLRASGWVSGKTWGYEVVLPNGFTTKGMKDRTVAAWQKLGVKRVGGKAFPRGSDTASLFRPAGNKGPVFLLLKNFRVIKRYNNATSYALAVGHLSDRLRGGGDFHGAWPEHEKPMTLTERQKLQALLTTKGYYSGDIDGNIGSGSREAIRNYQIAAGLKADGMETRDLLQHLEVAR